VVKGVVEHGQVNEPVRRPPAEHGTTAGIGDHHVFDVIAKARAAAGPVGRSMALCASVTGTGRTARRPKA
jgi:hypothetical protein